MGISHMLSTVIGHCTKCLNRERSEGLRQLIFLIHAGFRDSGAASPPTEISKSRLVPAPIRMGGRGGCV
jgi:hypothetical protein